MRIETITLTNFRQYYGDNTIDITTKSDKNIIVIGGKNGFGKTNFLLSLVWCFYGEDISKIDENFKREIQKAGNYSKFLKESLNWDAAGLGFEKFSVSIQLLEIELPETSEFESGSNFSCKLTREFNVNSGEETFQIEIPGAKESLFKTNDDKKVFVNDYLIPVEAAKFVFFDAEKIASWAELSTKEEGSVLNDALGKILGLDIYEALIKDLNNYTDDLRKESATEQVKQKISSTERGIEINTLRISAIDDEVIKIDNQIAELKLKIQEYEGYLTKRAGKGLGNDSLEELYKKRKELEQKGQELELKFNELSEVIPLAIGAATFQEVINHLEAQNANHDLKDKRLELIDKSNQLLEKLFNAPPYPEDGDISFNKKVFYADKAKRIVDDVFGSGSEEGELNFEHDLTKSEKDLLSSTYAFLCRQSKDVFEQCIDLFLINKGEEEKIERQIRRIEADQEDEEVIRYSTNKNDAQRRADKLIEERGGLMREKDYLKMDIDKLQQQLSILVKQINVSVQKRKKLEKANQYITALEAFVREQKQDKCGTLENNIYSEMQKLMHKLADDKGRSFVGAVKAESLPDNDGVKISLLNSEGEIRLKESLSQGEKQIYISSLIKAILSLSIQEYPIFIDTPLGRLDDEHIKSVLLNYYPELAAQVVLMATNNEIPPSRFKLVESNVARSYLIENDRNKSKFKPGYFQAYEN